MIPLITFSFLSLYCENTEYNGCNTHKLFTLSVGLLVNSRLLVVQFLGIRKFYVDF